MINCVFHLLHRVLVYVISVIMIKYTIPFSEICYLMNRSCLCFIDQPSWQLPNTALNIYLSRLCVHQLHHNHDIKEAFMSHSVQVLKHACFKPYQCCTPYSQCQLHENVYTMLPLTETEHMSFVPILSTILELPNRDALLPPKWKLSSFQLANTASPRRSHY